MCWKQLNSQTVQAVKAHGGDCTKDTGEDEVHGGVTHQVDQEGGAATEQHGQAQEELPTQLVHVEYCPNVCRSRGQGYDKTIDKHFLIRDMRTTLSGHIVTLVIFHFKTNNLTHTQCLIRMMSMELLKFVEQLREPEPETIVTKLNGKVDDNHGDGDVEQ